MDAVNVANGIMSLTALFRRNLVATKDNKVTRKYTFLATHQVPEMLLLGRIMVCGYTAQQIDNIL